MQGAEEGYTQVDEASVSRTPLRKPSDYKASKVHVFWSDCENDETDLRHFSLQNLERKSLEELASFEWTGKPPHFS